MKGLGLVLLVGVVALLIYVSADLPDRADPSSPANTHVSPEYIERAEREVGVPNVVTAVLVDYRSYDTLGETLVIFTAGLAVLLVLMRRGSDDRPS